MPNNSLLRNMMSGAYRGVALGGATGKALGKMQPKAKPMKIGNKGIQRITQRSKEMQDAMKD